MQIPATMHSSQTRAAGTRDALTGAVKQVGGGQQLGQQEFLKLLVTQLTNQDPLSPQDQSQFLAQLAQFSTVEGVNNLQSSQTHLQAAQLLGKTISAVTVLGGVQQNVSGKVSSVRWASDGVHLTVDGAKSPVDITLDQVGSVSN